MSILRPIALLSVALLSCSKQPLRDDRGSIEFATIHWFENEGVAYLFFRVNEDTRRFWAPNFDIEYDYIDEEGTAQHAKRDDIYSEPGVHEHQTVACGKKLTCGSYSFRLPGRLVDATLRFAYDKSDSITLQNELSVQNHLKDNGANSYSALMYGVFNEENDRVQVRTYHNFGLPSNDEIPAYGMKRKFLITGTEVFDTTLDEIAEHALAVESPTLFPASFCNVADQTQEAVISGNDTWLQNSFDDGQIARGVCFSGTPLDQDENALGEEFLGYARRNPVVSRGDFTYETPLTETVNIPVIVDVCPDEPFSAELRDEEFFEYQKYIVNQSDAPTDVCIRLGKLNEFKTELADVLASKLSDAKQASSGNKDFVFIVVFHQRLAKEFVTFHSALAGELTTIVSQEVVRDSPRLVGAFIYESDIFFKPTAVQQKYLLWCPQEQLNPEDVQDLGAKENCTILPSAKLDLKIINFVTPLGPFPSLAGYRDYLKKYDDKGLASGPKLKFYSVPQNVNTRTDSKGTVTFFSGERFAIGADERAKFCFDETTAGFDSLRFRKFGSADSEPNLTYQNINKVWLSDSAQGEYSIGVYWDFPFVGGVQYKSTVHGQILSIAPYTKSSRAYEALGDEKWRQTTWDIGSLVQHCRQYCDNPFFDEAGNYQIATAWLGLDESYCPDSKIPEWREE
ncbi:MAG: hypothetical protein AB7T49_13250 [Oligoflexales bacterium]